MLLTTVTPVTRVDFYHCSSTLFREREVGRGTKGEKELCFIVLVNAVKLFLAVGIGRRVNSVSNAAVRGDSYTEGCLGQTGE